MRFAKKPRQKGQSVIILALSITALLLCVGLAVDGSNVYLQRRCQQNAADSGAFAGARLLAANSQTTNGAVLAAVKKYVASSGGDTNAAEIRYVSGSTRLGTVDSYDPAASPPAGANGVYVKSSHTFAVFFAAVLGQRTKTAAAEATVMFGPSASEVFGDSAFPVTVDETVVQAAHPGDLIDIWDDSKVTDSAGNPLGGSRGWLNLNYIFNQTDPNSRTSGENFSDSELKTWAQYGKTPPVQISAGTVNGNDGDFINGDPGVRGAAIQASQARVGSVVLIPVYDRVVDRSYMSSTFTAPANGWDNGSYFHIVAFAQFKITHIVATGSGKYIQGAFIGTTLGEGKVLSNSTGAVFQSANTEVSLQLSDSP